MKFRKKPIEIEAVQFTGDNFDEVAEFMETPLDRLQRSIEVVFVSEIDFTEHKRIHIPTLEGTMIANCGDWIIKGVKGEFYPCKPDIFNETYESVEE